MQRKIEHMRKTTLRTALRSLSKLTPLSILGLLLTVNVEARSFDSFRFVGSDSTPSGTVTALTLSDTAPDAAPNTVIGELSFFNAAGFSSVFTLTASPSAVLNGQTRVYDPDNTQRLLSDVHDISFYTGNLNHSTDSVPPNWFRLTYYQGQWSGAFRVADQVYALHRSDTDGIVEVRTTHSTTDAPIASQRARITAVFNENLAASAQITALESVHVLDGLLTDAIGLTLTLEQLALTDINSQSVDEALVSAVDWQQSNTETIGLDDNLASLFFIEDPVENTTRNASALNRQAATLVQSLNTDPLFALGNSVGEYLGVPAQANTLQDWQATALVALPAVHWNQLQRDAFAAAPPAGVLQSINNDAPISAPDPLPQAPALDPVLVDSDSEERAPPVLQSDASDIPSTSGGGSGMWLLLVTLILFRHAAGLPARR